MGFTFRRAWSPKKSLKREGSKNRKSSRASIITSSGCQESTALAENKLKPRKRGELRAPELAPETWQGGEKMSGVWLACLKVEAAF